MDVNDLTYKELDISAFKIYDNFLIKLYIECKHSREKQWVFFLPEKFISPYIDHLMYFPPRIKPQLERMVPPRLEKTIFSVFEDFCEDKNIALNSAIFKGNKITDKDTSIRSAINTCINALIFHNLSFFQKPVVFLRPIICFALVVFDGLMFSYKKSEKDFELRQVNYLKYKHEFTIESWKYASDIKTIPEFNLIKNYQRTGSNIFHVEFIHQDYFSDYINKLEKADEKLNKIPIQKFLKLGFKIKKEL